MIKVLIVDDKTEKQGEIYNLITEVLGTEEVVCKCVTYAIDAKQYLETESADIMILDICLPYRQGEPAALDAGIRLLKELQGACRKYNYPGFVLGLSEHKDLVKQFSLREGIIHTSIHYDSSSNEWSIRLSECVKTVAAILKNNAYKRSYDYDIAVICALKEELDYVREDLQDVRSCKINDEDITFYTGVLMKEGRKIRVVATKSTEKGMSAAAALTTKMIHDFAPKYMVMTGIAAGIKSKVNPGDVVVAKYAWDYGAGKEVLEGDQEVHNNSIDQISIGTEMETWATNLSEDSGLLAEIESGFRAKKPGTVLRLHVGPVATGAAVIANENKVRKIQNQIRDVVAIEMEVYGVYYAAKWAINPKPRFVAVKSVCDFADSEKTDDYHAFADYTSAKVFYYLATRYFKY